MKTNIHPSWDKVLGRLLYNKEINPLISTISKEEAYIPKNINLIFKAFENPLEDLKVVILGKKPIGNILSASGLAYTYSIDNYNCTINNKLSDLIYPVDGVSTENVNKVSIDSWSSKGVMLLNTSLTTQTGLEEYHREKWEPFIIQVILKLSRLHPTIWMIFSKDLIKYTSVISNKFFVSNYSKETINNIPITRDYNYIFYNSQEIENIDETLHFNFVNIIIKKLNKGVIKW